MRSAMRLRAMLQGLDVLPGGVRGLGERADRWMRACEEATTYAELACAFGELQKANAGLATAGPRDPDRERRTRSIVDRLHAAAPLSDLAAMIAGTGYGDLAVACPAAACAPGVDRGPQAAEHKVEIRGRR